MKRKASLFVFLLVIANLSSFGQQRNKLILWRWMSFQGSVSLTGQYNESFSGSKSILRSYQYGAGAGLSTQNFVWHPNFLTINMSGSYHPQLGETVSTLQPDYFSNYSNRNFAIYTRFLSTLPYKFNIYAENSFQKGEDQLYDLDIENTKYGIDFNYTGVLDVRASVDYNSDNRYDNLTDRSLLLDQTSLKGELKKTDSLFGRNTLNFNLQKVTSEQTNFFKNTNEITNLLFNNSKELALLKGIFFNTNVNFNSSSGSSSYQNIGILENLNIRLTNRLIMNSNYSFNKLSSSNDVVKENRYGGSLSYSLYSSLQTTIAYDKNTQNRINNAGIKNSLKTLGVEYSKKIPLIKGNIAVNYNYRISDQSNQSGSISTFIYNDRYAIRDSEIMLLRSPNINIASVIVTDLTGTIVYEKDIDYIVIALGRLLQIQRLVGGRIADGETVEIDYETLNNNSYTYKAVDKELNLRLGLLKNLVALQLNKSSRNYDLIGASADLIGLDEYDKIKYGAQIKFRQLMFESFYEDRESNLFSYKLLNYSISANGMLSKKINYKLSGMMNNYFMYFKDGMTNKLTNISTDINYTVSNYSKLAIGLSYMQQRGSIENYNLTSSRIDFITRFRQLGMSLGVNYYNRDVPSSEFKQNYFGAQIKLTRNF